LKALFLDPNAMRRTWRGTPGRQGGVTRCAKDVTREAALDLLDCTGKLLPRLVLDSAYLPKRGLDSQDSWHAVIAETNSMTAT